MKFRPRLFTIILALIAVCQVIISIDSQDIAKWQEGSFKTAMSFSVSYKWPVLVILAIFVPVLTTFKEEFGPKQMKAAFRRTLMQGIIDDVFDKDKVHNRVTIFMDTRWSRICLTLWRQSIKHPIETLKGKRTLFPKWGKYLRVVSRIATENEKSTTFFYYSSKTQAECEGIAGFVRQTQTELKEDDLPDITEINLDSVNLESNTKDAKNVKKYMKRGRVANIETLKRIHLRARHFYGNILYNAKSEPVGVLIIDSSHEESPFDETRIDKLSGYIKLFSSAF